MKYLYILSFLLVTNGFSQNTITKDMQAYLSDNGTLGYYAQVVDSMFDFLKNEYKDQNVPETLWQELMTVKPDALNDITASIIDVYKAHFSDDELREMLNFYNSETGKKVNSGLPLTKEEENIRQAFNESVIAKKISNSGNSINAVLKTLTQDWSAQLFIDAKAKLQAKGFIKE